MSARLRVRAPHLHNHRPVGVHRAVHFDVQLELSETRTGAEIMMVVAGVAGLIAVVALAVGIAVIA
jgi:hypothetical protein